MVKKVLIISYAFPPFNSIAAVRTAKFAQYLPYYGWTPIILTSHKEGETGLGVPEGLEIIRTDYKDKYGYYRRQYHKARFTDMKSNYRTNSIRNYLFREASFWYRELFVFPDEMIGWNKYAFKKGMDILRTKDVKVIFSTSPPITSHIIANQLSIKMGLPWVAEFRDLWCDSQQRHTRIRKYISRKFERNILKNASILVSVSEHLVEKLCLLHKKPVQLITNGFDHGDYEQNSPYLTNLFSITYTGSFYEGKQDLNKLFAAVSELLKKEIVEVKSFALRFYGPHKHQQVILTLARKYGVESVLHHGGFLPYDESVKRQVESSVLLLLGWNDQTEKGIYTGKVFEYLGAKRPILLISRNDDEDELVKLIKKTKAGVIAESEEEIFTIIKNWYKTFLENKTLPYEGDIDIINQYTRDKQTEKLAKVFDSLV